jgi:hypothetical protein
MCCEIVAGATKLEHSNRRSSLLALTPPRQDRSLHMGSSNRNTTRRDDHG